MRNGTCIHRATSSNSTSSHTHHFLSITQLTVNFGGKAPSLNAVHASVPRTELRVRELLAKGRFTVRLPYLSGLSAVR